MPLLLFAARYSQANTVASRNAMALVVINNGPEGEDLFRVAATLGGRSGGGEEPKGPENMPTVSQTGGYFSMIPFGVPCLFF